MDIIFNIVLNVISAAIWGVAGGVITCILQNRKRLRLLGASFVKRNETIRISAAYLFRIEIDGKYLLVKGKRIGSQYQPVGGVYKRFASSKNLLDGLSVTADDSLRTCDKDSDDLRIRLPRKNVLKFIDWFDSLQGRETQVLREFKEELVDPGYLGLDSLANFKAEFIRQSSRKLSHSPHFQVTELLMSDIYEVYLSNDEKELLKSHVDDATTDLVLATVDELKREAIFINGSSSAIGAHAKKVL